MLVGLERHRRAARFRRWATSSASCSRWQRGPCSEVWSGLLVLYVPARAVKLLRWWVLVGSALRVFREPSYQGHSDSGLPTAGPPGSVSKAAASPVTDIPGASYP